MYCDFRYYYLEDIEMNDFKDEYRNLKDSINPDNSKIVSFLVLDVLLGRLIEKFYKQKNGPQVISGKLRKTVAEFHQVDYS